MKLSAISIAIVFAAIVGTASAAGQGQTMSPVNAFGSPIAECAPPNDTAGHACDALNQLVRVNFTPREIGMLFGNVSSYPESRTGGIERLQRRYQAVMQAYLAAQQNVSTADFAIK